MKLYVVSLLKFIEDYLLNKVSAELAYPFAHVHFDSFADCDGRFKAHPLIIGLADVGYSVLFADQGLDV